METANRTPLLTGGCQCGATRFCLYTRPFTPHICYCRMCQKAGGSFAMTFAVVNHSNFAWTRGAPKLFASSQFVNRGFCGDCGTPLSFQRRDRIWINVAIGAFDTPGQVAPVVSLGTESKLPWADALATLPSTPTQIGGTPQERAGLQSRQHPDHDTAQWPA
jgi:hypothetical protein